MAEHSEATEWAPIEGISLDRYADLTRELAADGVVGPLAIDRWMTDRGVPSGTWARVAAGWSSRMMRHTAIRHQFDDRRAGRDRW
jgi:hypothetical protein